MNDGQKQDSRRRTEMKSEMRNLKKQALVPSIEHLRAVNDEFIK